jgi:hypothetical protein
MVINYKWDIQRNSSTNDSDDFDTFIEDALKSNPTSLTIPQKYHAVAYGYTIKLYAEDNFTKSNAAPMKYVRINEDGPPTVRSSLGNELHI